MDIAKKKAVLLVALVGACQVSVAGADSLCIKKKLKVVGGYVNVVGALKTYPKCPSTHTEVLDTDELKGEKGEQGADGSLRIYGDGSSGALNVSSNVTLNSANTQFTNISIEAGATFSVPSGTVLRCTGNFVNKGTLKVQNYAWGGIHSATTSGMFTINSGFANPGIIPGAASNGAWGNSTTAMYGGYASTGVYGGAAQARQILKPGPLGGGGGGAGGLVGAPGGGTITVLCRGSITNQGKIDAQGAKPLFDLGDGGGGGGIVILASRTSVVNDANGIIDVRGGDGGDSYEGAAAGGGGGGGWTHFIAPSIQSNGKIFILGGYFGHGYAAVTTSRRFAGGAGGAGYGSGGYGGNANTNNSATEGSKGASGIALETIADPTSLF